MSDKPVSTIEEDVERGRREAQRIAEQERRDMTQQAVDRGIMEDVAQNRADNERLSEEIEEAVARDNPADSRARARRDVLPTILLLIMLFLILYLIAAATGRSNIIQFPNSQQGPGPLQPALNGSGQVPDSTLNSVSNLYPGNVGAPGSAPITAYNIDPIFQQYYVNNGGLTVFGYPMSNLMEVNGRAVQWFERARLEQWNDAGYAGTPYAIQGGRIGVEYIGNRVFPKQAPFVSTPTNRYFAETGYGVRSLFLSYWEQRDGLRMFGYPISNELQEKLPDGKVYTVQYFERGRMEYHPELANTPYEIEIGLLGTSLHMQTDKPNITSAPVPTVVPLPTPGPAYP